MTDESASGRQQQWNVIVRRSFDIEDHVSDDEARRSLITCVEEQLRENGWHGVTRAIAEPMIDALMAFAADGELDARLHTGDARGMPGTFTSRDAAHRLLDKGTTVVDPERLAFDVMGEYPPEVVAVAEQALDRVSRYVQEHPDPPPRLIGPP